MNVYILTFLKCLLPIPPPSKISILKRIPGPLGTFLMTFIFTQIYSYCSQQFCKIISSLSAVMGEKKNTFFLTEHRYYHSDVLVGHCVFGWKAPLVWISCNKVPFDIFQFEYLVLRSKESKVDQIHWIGNFRIWMSHISNLPPVWSAGERYLSHLVLCISIPISGNAGQIWRRLNTARTTKTPWSWAQCKCARLGTISKIWRFLSNFWYLCNLRCYGDNLRCSNLEQDRIRNNLRCSASFGHSKDGNHNLATSVQYSNHLCIW